MARGAVAGNKITLAFGGNQVLPAVAATTFTDGTDF